MIAGMSHAVSIADLIVRYRGKKGEWIDAVQGLSLEVRVGEIVGFLGPNGAGKSSTIKALMGFAAPESGSCEVFDLPAGSVGAKRRIGYLPEVALYYPFLTPLETLTLYGELQGLRGRALRKESVELLERVGLTDALHKQNRSLSKGMLQRVGIAQALLGSPDLLVLDEVTSGLDPVGRRELRQLLRDRQRQGATLFFSSHELAEVDMLCDRILLIDHGKLVEERSMAALKEELRQYVLRYRGASPLDLAARSVTPESAGVVRAEFAEKADLLRALETVQKSGAEVVDVVSQEGSLEDYFVERVGRAA
jgi:ABC-2 type transport system ATP-binding protein